MGYRRGVEVKVKFQLHFGRRNRLLGSAELSTDISKDNFPVHFFGGKRVKIQVNK